MRDNESLGLWSERAGRGQSSNSFREAGLPCSVVQAEHSRRTLGQGEEVLVEIWSTLPLPGCALLRGGETVSNFTQRYFEGLKLL